MCIATSHMMTEIGTSRVIMEVGGETSHTMKVCEATESA